MLVPDWRQTSLWDPDVDSVTTGVGEFLRRYRQPDEWLGRLVRKHLTAGTVLKGREGVELLDRLIDNVEAELERHIWRADALHLFAGLRRLSRRLWMDSNYDPVESASRVAAELAVRRWGRWPFVRQDPDERAFRWDRGDHKLLARLLLLAETHVGASALRRRVGKNQAVRISDEVVLSSEPADEEAAVLEPLILGLDRRRMEPSGILGSLGQHTSREEPEEDLRILSSHRRPLDDLKTNPHGGEAPAPGWEPIPFHDLQATHGWQAGMLSCLEATLHLDPVLQSTYGCGLTEVMLALELFSLVIAYKAAEEPFTTERLWRYGYACARWPSQELLDELPGEAARRNLPRSSDITRGTVDAALQVVMSEPEIETPRDTQSMRPVIRLGEWYAYDMLSVYDFLVGFLRNLEADPKSEDTARRRLELQTHEALAAFGRQPWPQGRRIKQAHETLTDLDAHVVRKGVLLVADCYSVRWTTELDRGHHAKTKSRAERVRAKLAKWDAVWTRIANGAGRASLPLDAQGVHWILPVVVTADPEWVDTTDPAFWLTDQVPRILSVSELIRLLDGHDVAQLQNQIRVNRPGDP